MVKNKSQLIPLLSKFKKYILLELGLLCLAFFYYSIFANRGLDFFDEGYYVHAAERVFNGEVPYKDFALQYAPTYFYLLAFLYKIFGPSIIVGRYLTLFVCLLILCFTFLILNKLKATSYKVILLSFLGIISFGYPLINIPLVVWPSVLVSLALVLSYIYWIETKDKKQYFYLFVMGFLLALVFSLRQNLGVSFIILCNFLLVFGKKVSFVQKTKNLLVVNSTLLILTVCWMYYFFLRDNITGLLEFITFSKKFISEFGFTYPPLSYIFEPSGLLKLLPYYLPIIFLLFVIKYLFNKDKDWKLISFCLMALVGFFTYVYPNSELLHVYPFWGLLLVSMMIFFSKKKRNVFASLVLCLMIGIGFYLSLFREYYRYNPPYKFQNTYVSLPKAGGIYTEKTKAENLLALSQFINQHTVKNDYIFSYPYYPMLYFLLERRNPSKDLIYAPRLWHQYDDKIILNEIKKKKVAYIVTTYGYAFDSDLSLFIQKQKKVFNNQTFTVFEVLSLNKK
jgi:hypothetical protein